MNDTLVWIWLLGLPVLLWAFWHADDSEGNNTFFGVLLVAYLPLVAALAILVVPLWLLFRKK